MHPIHFAYFYCYYTKNRMKYLGMSRTCTQNVPVLTILGHLQKCPESICPMSFLNLSNLSYVLSQTCLKMCPRPDMSRPHPRRVPDVSSKFPYPDHFGTSPNRTSATKLLLTIDKSMIQYNICSECLINYSTSQLAHY